MFVLYVLCKNCMTTIVNRKADFLQNESIQIDSHNESNRFESRIGMLYHRLRGLLRLNVRSQHWIDVNWPTTSRPSYTPRCDAFIGHAHQRHDIIGSVNDWLIDWLTDRSIDWSIDWLIWLILIESWFYVQLDTRDVSTSQYLGLVWKKLNLTQQQHAFTSQRKCTTT